MDMNVLPVPNNHLGNDPSALVSLRRFRGDMGVVPSTAWRWTKRGWLEKPINIGGRQYLTVAMIHRFLERAARGEFASVIKPPTRISASVNQNGGAV